MKFLFSFFSLLENRNRKISTRLALNWKSIKSILLKLYKLFKDFSFLAHFKWILSDLEQWWFFLFASCCCLNKNKKLKINYFVLFCCHCQINSELLGFCMISAMNIFAQRLRLCQWAKVKIQTKVQSIALLNAKRNLFISISLLFHFLLFYQAFCSTLKWNVWINCKYLIWQIDHTSPFSIDKLR